MCIWMCEGPCELHLVRFCVGRWRRKFFHWSIQFQHVMTGKYNLCLCYFVRNVYALCLIFGIGSQMLYRVCLIGVQLLWFSSAVCLWLYSAKCVMLDYVYLILDYVFSRGIAAAAAAVCYRFNYPTVFIWLTSFSTDNSVSAIRLSGFPPKLTGLSHSPPFYLSVMLTCCNFDCCTVPECISYDPFVHTLKDKVLNRRRRYRTWRRKHGSKRLFRHTSASVASGAIWWQCCRTTATDRLWLFSLEVKGITK